MAGFWPKLGWPAACPSVGHDDLQPDSFAHVARPGAPRHHGRRLTGRPRRWPLWPRCAASFRGTRPRCASTTVASISRARTAASNRPAGSSITRRRARGLPGRPTGLHATRGSWAAVRPSTVAADKLYRQAQPGPIHPRGWLSQTGCSPCCCSRPTTNTGVCRLTGRRRPCHSRRSRPPLWSPRRPFDTPHGEPYRGAPRSSEHP